MQRRNLLADVYEVQIVIVCPLSQSYGYAYLFNSLTSISKITEAQNYFRSSPVLLLSITVRCILLTLRSSSHLPIEKVKFRQSGVSLKLAFALAFPLLVFPPRAAARKGHRATLLSCLAFVSGPSEVYTCQRLLRQIDCLSKNGLQNELLCVDLLP